MNHFEQICRLVSCFGTNVPPSYFLELADRMGIIRELVSDYVRGKIKYVPFFPRVIYFFTHVPVFAL